MNQSSYLDVKSRTNEQYGDRISKKLNLNIQKNYYNQPNRD